MPEEHEVEVSGDEQEGDDEGDEMVEGEDMVPDLPMSERTARTLDFSIGKISMSSKEALSKQLATRMDPDRFKERFSNEESQGESALNRTTRQLGALLANRLSVQRLQGLGIIKEGSGKLQAQQAALKREQTRDNLSALLGNRQTKEDLVSKGILLNEASDEKKRLVEAKKLLSSFLVARPGQLDLTRKNILKAETSSTTESKDAKQVLGDFFSVKRPPLSVKIAVHRPFGNQLTPHTVPKLSGIQSVSCGWSHTVALDGNGEAWVFGDSSDGRLGLGDLKEFPEEPVVNSLLKGLGRVSSVCCGDHHTAAVVQGKLYTWGMGAWGRLGLGSQDDVSSPQEVRLPGEVVVQVACGAYHTLVLTEGGKVYGFGWNKNGRVGVGKEAETAVLSPGVVVLEEKVKVQSVCCGQDASFAVTDAGEVYSWGSGAGGGLGHGDSVDCWTPRRIDGLTNIASVSAGALYAVALTRDGKVFSWGLNKDSQLGRVSDTSLAPALIEGLLGVQSVACGKQHMLAVRQGQVLSWGRGASGILGTNSEDNEIIPKQLPGLSSCKQVAASGAHSAIVMADGSLRTMGSGHHGRLGYAPDCPPESSPLSGPVSPRPSGLQTPTKILRKASM